jgi:hypothetical protein
MVKALSAIRRYDLEIQGVESIWLEILLKSKKLLYCTFFRPSNYTPSISDRNVYWSHFQHNFI